MKPATATTLLCLIIAAAFTTTITIALQVDVAPSSLLSTRNPGAGRQRQLMGEGSKCQLCRGGTSLLLPWAAGIISRRSHPTNYGPGPFTSSTTQEDSGMPTSNPDSEAATGMPEESKKGIYIIKSEDQYK